MTDQFDRPSPVEIHNAVAQLSEFVRNEARTTATELGFGWRPASRGPADLPELQAEFRSCHSSGLPLRVLRGFSEATVFDRPPTNHAMRFINGTRHVWLSADFTTEAELEVASCHLARAKSEGLSPGSLEFALLQADTVGQTLYIARTKQFVVNQLAFALDCIRFDFDTAVEREVNRRLCLGTAS